MRIIGGEASGIPIVAPSGRATRPTGDKVREALFNTLAARIVDARVLDLYAGSGALGLEALSRGAQAVCWVERHSRTARIIRENLARTRLPQEKVRLLVMDAVLACRRLVREQQMFDLIICDPPWAQGMAPEVLERLHDLVAKASGIVVIEGERGSKGPLVPGLAPVSTREYGRTVLHYFRGVEASP